MKRQMQNAGLALILASAGAWAQAPDLDAELAKLAAERERGRLEMERERIVKEKAALEKLRGDQDGARRIPTVPLGGDLQTAIALEAEGKGADAVAEYIRAARSGNCQAARRLGGIYEKGLIGISRNYAESLKWYNAARGMGCDVQLPAK